LTDVSIKKECAVFCSNLDYLQNHISQNDVQIGYADTI